jgi:hypothetical protein
VRVDYESGVTRSRIGSGCCRACNAYGLVFGLRSGEGVSRKRCVLDLRCAAHSHCHQAHAMAAFNIEQHCPVLFKLSARQRATFESMGGQQLLRLDCFAAVVL